MMKLALATIESKMVHMQPWSFCIPKVSMFHCVVWFVGFFFFLFLLNKGFGVPGNYFGLNKTAEESWQSWWRSASHLPDGNVSIWKWSYQPANPRSWEKQNTWCKTKKIYHFSMKIYPMYYVVFARWIKGEICCGRLKVISFQLLKVYKVSLQGARWFFACAVLVDKTLFCYSFGHHLVSLFHPNRCPSAHYKPHWTIQLWTGGN